MEGRHSEFRIPNSARSFRIALDVESHRKVRRMALKTSFCDLAHDVVAALDLHCYWTHRTISSFTSPFAGLLFSRFRTRFPRGAVHIDALLRAAVEIGRSRVSRRSRNRRYSRSRTSPCLSHRVSDCVTRESLEAGPSFPHGRLHDGTMRNVAPQTLPPVVQPSSTCDFTSGRPASEIQNP